MCVFTGVKVTVESLPRSESSLLAVKLDTLFLRDLTTQGTIFPFLVSPKTVKIISRQLQPNQIVKSIITIFLMYGLPPLTYFHIGDNIGQSHCRHQPAFRPVQQFWWVNVIREHVQTMEYFWGTGRKMRVNYRSMLIWRWEHDQLQDQLYPSILI